MPSHFGEPDVTIRQALAELAARGVRVNHASGLYRTPCVPAGAGPDYINAACEVSFDGTPQDLLAICNDIERVFGRTRHGRWQARPVDIDLIAAGDVVLPDRPGFEFWRGLDFSQQQEQTPTDLILPHPRMQDRAFVLIPVADFAPDWRHPVLDLTVAEMLDALPIAEKQAIQPVFTV